MSKTGERTSLHQRVVGHCHLDLRDGPVTVQVNHADCIHVVRASELDLIEGAIREEERDRVFAAIDGNLLSNKYLDPDIQGLHLWLAALRETL